MDIDNSQGFWQFESTSAKVNGKTIARPGNTAIADTGTTLALVDDKVCEAVYAAIPGAKLDKQQQVSRQTISNVSNLVTPEADVLPGMGLPIVDNSRSATGGPIRRGLEALHRAKRRPCLC